MNVVVGAGLAGILIVTALLVLVWRMLSSTKVRGVDPDWLKNFSVSSYRPMERLLHEDDIVFLKAHPGYEPGLDQKLRAQRRRVFRLYLNDLGRDFNRLHYALRLMVLHGPKDNPELAKTLIKQKLVFFAALFAVRVRIEFYSLGMGGVDVSGLVSTLDAMRAELHGLMAAPLPAGAVS